MKLNVLFKSSRTCYIPIKIPLLGLLILLSVYISPVFAGEVFQNKVNVTGNVQDEKGEALPGVNVTVKGTSIGTTTDVNGNYSLNLSEKQDVLVFSFIGYATQEVAVNDRAVLNVTLEEDVKSLDEVVVVGYGTQKKKDITGSVAVVEMEALKSIPAGSAAEALQGQASGVTVINSGVPGDASKVMVRGITSFGNTQPLVLIDGVEADLNDISANDIQSIQVLKDAGAAAIYGVRGANGVIVVTTKKGRSGKTSITYDAYYGMQLPLQDNPYNLMNSTDFARLYNVVEPGNPLFQNGLPDFLYGGQGVAGVAMAGDPEVDPAKYTFDPINTANNYFIQKVNKEGTDWFDELFNPAPISNHTLTASGGNDKANYLFSLGYLDQQGTLIESFSKRYSARINSQYKLNKNIRIGENVNFFYKNRSGLNNPPIYIYRTIPIIPVYDIEGNYGGTFGGAGLGNSENPVARQERMALNDRNHFWNVVGNAYIEVDFLENFTARSSFGGSLENGYQQNFTFTSYESKNGSATPNRYNENANYSSRLMWTNTLKYAKVIDKHSISLLIGSEIIENSARRVGGSSSGFFSTDYNYLILDNGTTSITNSSNASVSSLFSLFSRIDYAFNDKYLLGGTIRQDGSSKFGAERRFGIFPSASLGWRISKEAFMQDISWLNDLKFRGSYGVLGSQNNVGAENAYSLYGGDFGNAYYDITGSSNSVEQGFIKTRIGNPNTGWEENIVTNIGLDASLFDYKLNLSFEYYKKSINGLLFTQPLPATVGGATYPVVNIGDIQNKGFDASVTYMGSIGSDLQFSIGANLTSYKNLVMDIPDPGYFDAGGTQVLQPIARNQEGHAVSSFYGYDVIGLFNSDDDVVESPAQSGAAAGRLKYRDVNGDGVITPDDRTFLGSPNPDFTYGLNIGLNYKGFDFSTIFYGTQGNEIVNVVRSSTHFFVPSPIIPG
jgi:TonB-linked SusC/RagA family outer membrane protein